jgi:hypothetical protein
MLAARLDMVWNPKQYEAFMNQGVMSAEGLPEACLASNKLTKRGFP